MVASRQRGWGCSHLCSSLCTDNCPGFTQTLPTVCLLPCTLLLLSFVSSPLHRLCCCAFKTDISKRPWLPCVVPHSDNITKIVNWWSVSFILKSGENQWNGPFNIMTFYYFIKWLHSASWFIKKCSHNIKAAYSNVLKKNYKVLKRQ